MHKHRPRYIHGWASNANRSVGAIWLKFGAVEQYPAMSALTLHLQAPKKGLTCWLAAFLAL
jgi:hypothetical protein